MSETRNRVWIVRDGTDGTGRDLFHVYAPDMTTARLSARDAAAVVGFVFGDDFTVHALPYGVPLEPFSNLAWNTVTDRPAIDFYGQVTDGRFDVTPVPSADEMRAHAQLKIG